MIRRFAVALAAVLVGAVAMHAQSAPPPAGETCLGEVFITEPACGANFINQSSMTIRGHVRGASGTLRISISSSVAGIYTVPIQSAGPCADNPFELTVPLSCGCMQITAVMENNPAVVLETPLFVRQGPPVTYMTFAGQVIQLGGCPGGEASSCLNLSCGASASTTGAGDPGSRTTGGTTGTATTRCEGGSATCSTTDVVSVSGSASTTDTVVKFCGPLNHVTGVVSQTPTFIEGRGAVYPWTASGIRLNPGQNSVTFLQAVGTSVLTTSVSMCVDLTAPPRVCLTFQSPGNQSTVSTALTTATGTVTPSNATVTLLSGAVTQPTTVDANGQFSFPLMLNPGANAVQLNASLGATTVGIIHSITLSATQTAPGTTTPLFAVVRVEAHDRAGNLGFDETASVTTDFTAPVFSRLSAAPTPATTGTTVTITFDTNEALSPTPSVSVGGHEAAFVAFADKTYTFVRTISGDEGEGQPVVVVRGTDLAHNAGSLTGEPLTLDFQAPRIGALSVSPAAATTGTTVAVSFSVDEDLGTTPVVRIHGRPFELSDLTSKTYRFTRTIDGSEGSGSRQIELSVVDRAGNTAHVTGSVALDFVAPVLTFHSITPAYATRLTTVVAEVESNEPLDGRPQVKLGNRDLEVAEENGQSYTFVLRLDGSEATGASTIAATAQDPAGNKISAVTSGPIIDFVKPDVSNPSVAPSVGKFGTTVTIQFEVSETLATTPTVRIAEALARFVSLSDRHYTFERELDGAVPEATNQATALARDLAGNEREASLGSVRADYTPPDANAISVSPTSARTGTVVTIAFSENETLATTPLVNVGAASASLTSFTSGSYRFERTLSGSEGQGDVEISVKLEDVAHNTKTASGGTIHTDFTHPGVTSASVAPTVARTGTEIEARFSASESLSTTPVVTLGTLQFALQSQNDKDYVFNATVIGNETEKTQPVRAVLTDLIGNESTVSLGTIRTDFTAPRFAPVSVSPSVAASGTQVTISFTASEALTETPAVSVGSQSAQLASADGQSYVFERTVDGSEAEGSLVVIVSGRDLAGNDGEDVSGKLTTDFTRPVPNDVQVHPSAGREGTQIILSFVPSEAVTQARVLIADQPFVAIGNEDGRYAFSRVLDRHEGEGARPTRIELVDPAGNRSSTEGPAVMTDFTTPTITFSSVSPGNARIGTTSSIRLDVSEPLARIPAVLLGGQPATFVSSAAPRFEFERTITGEETEGEALIRVTLEDPAGNTGVHERPGCVTDFTPPSFESVHVTTGPLSVGAMVVVSVTMSESLATTPEVGLQLFDPVIQIGRTYVFMRVITGAEPEGEVPIVMRATDIAGNVGQEVVAHYVTDFTPPAALDLRAVPPAATRGTTVVVEFNASEPLAYPPDLLVGGRAAQLVRDDQPAYAFARTLLGDESESHASVELRMVDIAGNESAITTSPFVIDFTHPDPVVTPFPVPGREGEGVSLSALGSWDSSGISAVQWSVDGIRASTAPLFSHGFADGPTTHTIELTVTDGVGLSSSAKRCLPVVNVSPTVLVQSMPSIVRGITTVPWTTVEPGTDDNPMVAIVAQDLVTPMRTELTAGQPDRQRYEWDTSASKESSFQLFVTVRDKDGGEDTAASQPVIVDNRPLAIATKGAQPRYFNPRFGEGTDLTYTLSEHADVSVEVVRSIDRSRVATVLSLQRQIEGAHLAAWTGLDANGEALTDGEYGYIVRGRDLTGAATEHSSLDDGVVVVLDTTPPAAPAVDPVPRLVAEEFITLSGSTEPDTGVVIATSTGSPLASTPFSEAGTGTARTRWSAAVRLSQGANDLTLLARDRAGNRSPTLGVQVSLDSIAPAPPTITSPVPAQTDADALEVAGTKEANSALVVNGTRRQVTADTTWTERFDLRAFQNTFRFRAVDEAGNMSGEVAATTTRVPNVVADPTVLAPATSRTATAIVTGTKQPGTDLVVRTYTTLPDRRPGQPSGRTVTIPPDDSTEWSIAVELVDPGRNSFSAQSVDGIGSPSHEVFFGVIRDATPPVVALLAGLSDAVATTENLNLGIEYQDVLPFPAPPGGVDLVTGIDVESVRILVDGADRSASASISETLATLPASQMTTGLHRIDGQARDRAGNPATVSGSFYVHPPDDGRAPEVSITRIRGEQLTPGFNPYSVDHETRANLDYTVNVPITGGLRVRSTAGSMVRTVSVPRSFPATVNTVGWDGRDDTGVLVKSGVFELVLEASNIFGRKTIAPPVTVRIHY